MLLHRLLRPSGLAERRRSLLAGATGAVLELGAGTGRNLAHYPATVGRLVLSDPNAFMRRRLGRRVRVLGRDAEVVEASAERLPFLENTFDEVVCTLVLCTVDQRVAALHEVRRVLRPRGRLRFLEHVAATPDGPSRLQRSVGPVQAALGGGCRPDLVMDEVLQAAGFTVATIETWSLPHAPPWLRPAVSGVAVAPP